MLSGRAQTRYVSEKAPEEALKQRLRPGLSAGGFHARSRWARVSVFEAAAQGTRVRELATGRGVNPVRPNLRRTRGIPAQTGGLKSLGRK